MLKNLLAWTVAVVGIAAEVAVATLEEWWPG